jgi:Lon protease-like protein
MVMGVPSGGSELELIPLFPLHTVLFPGGMLPLNVFEERYRALVRERVDFGVVLIRQGSEVGAGRAEDLHEIGTVATLERVEALADGRFSVLARGVERFRLRSLDHSRPYLMGRVERLEDPPAMARPRLVALLERYLAAHDVEVTPQLTPELGRRAVWLVGTALQVEPARRQALLASGDADLAELMLAEELAKLAGIGRLGQFVPRQPPSN